MKNWRAARSKDSNQLFFMICIFSFAIYVINTGLVNFPMSSTTGTISTITIFPKTTMPREGEEIYQSVPATVSTFLRFPLPFPNWMILLLPQALVVLKILGAVFEGVSDTRGHRRIELRTTYQADNYFADSSLKDEILQAHKEAFPNE